MVAVGVDGCAKGWVAAAVDDGRVRRVEFLATIAGLPERFPDATVVGVDMPMGFPIGARPRPSELEARRLLGPLWSSVFLTPPRVVLEQPSHSAATVLAKELTGKGISQQSYALRNKIFEVVDWVARRGRLDVYEVHPELSFLRLTGAPVTPSKRTWGGMTARQRALAAAGLEVRNVTDEAARVPVDDVLDAVAAAWSADRVRRGTAVAVPDEVDDLDAGDVSIWS